MNLISLPSEIQFNILSRLNERDLASLGSTCTYFKHFSTDSHFSFPRISSDIFKNLQERKYHLSSFPHSISIQDNEVLWVKDSEPVLLRIGKDTLLDDRTTVKFGYHLKKTITISKTRIHMFSSSLYANDKQIDKDVLDFACLNGIIIYSTLSGLYRYSLAADKIERISKNHYDKIAVDEKNGIIYGLTKDSIDTLDFGHPDAISRKEDSTPFLIKRKIIDVVATFFKEIKNYALYAFEWKSVGWAAVGGVIGALLVTSVLGATFAEALAIFAVIIIVVAFSIAVLVSVEVLKHALTKTFDVAVKPL